MFKIAIIEDDVLLAEMYRIKFESKDYHIRVAHNGIEGLALCQKHKPELILLDLMMPEMTGLEMLKRLRAEKWGASTRVIILTNISKYEAPTELRLLNVDRYIVKAHHTPGQVVDVAEEILGEKSQPK